MLIRFKKIEIEIETKKVSLISVQDLIPRTKCKA